MGRQTNGEKPRPRILIVESDPDQRTLLGLVIRNWGYDCEESSEVVTALQRLSTGAVQILITDSHLADGFARELLVCAANHGIPSLLISSRAPDEWPTGQKCLPKPLDLELLLLELRALQSH